MANEAQKAIMRLAGLDVFEHRTESDNRCPYRFMMPHIAISGEPDLDFDRDRKQWHLVQPDGDHHHWEAWGDTQEEAVLALIAARVTGEPVAYGKSVAFRTENDDRQNRLRSPTD